MIPRSWQPPRGWITFGDPQFLYGGPSSRGFPKAPSFSGTLSPGIYNRGSSWIILVRLYHEGSSHDAVTSLGLVESGVLGFHDSAPETAPRSLADEKSLTTELIWKRCFG